MTKREPGTKVWLVLRDSGGKPCSFDSRLVALGDDGAGTTWCHFGRPVPTRDLYDTPGEAAEVVASHYDRQSELYAELARRNRERAKELSDV